MGRRKRGVRQPTKAPAPKAEGIRGLLRKYRQVRLRWLLALGTVTVVVGVLVGVGELYHLTVALALEWAIHECLSFAFAE